MEKFEIKIERCLEFLSYFYPETLLKYLKGIHRCIYNGKIKRKLKRHGVEFRIKMPLVLVGGEYIEIGERFRAEQGLILSCFDNYNGLNYMPHISIGDNAYFGRNNHLGCINEIIIGNNILTGSNVLITDHIHGYSDQRDIDVPPRDRDLYSKGKVYIGNNVWLGDNVKIMPGVTIGNGVIIGANAVVTKDIPDNCVVAGVPAQIIKRLDHDNYE